MGMSTIGFIVEYPAALMKDGIPVERQREIAQAMTDWALAIQKTMETVKDHSFIDQLAALRETAKAHPEMNPLLEPDLFEGFDQKAPAEAEDILLASGLSDDFDENLETLQEILSEFSKGMDFRDTASRLIPADHLGRERIAVFSGASTWGDGPDGAGYQFLKRLSIAGLFKPLGIA